MNRNVVALLLAALLLPLTLAGPSAAARVQSDDSRQTRPPRIIDGTPTADGEYPFLAALVFVPSDDNFCGASVIDDYWVLTAATCVHDLHETSFDVVTGRHNLLCDDFGGDPACTDGQRHDVSEIHLHPLSNFFTYNNDIALIKLATPTVAPHIAWATAVDAPAYAPGIDATVIGWGASHTLIDPQYPATPLQAEVVLLGDAECEATRDPGAHFTGETMICAGSNGVGPCRRDQGGPLFVPDGGGGYLQVGVVSQVDCGEPSFPDIYAEVPLHDGFIQGLVGTTSILCDGKPVTINMNTNGGNGTGTANADVILGTPNPDVIIGLGGNDTICAGDGDDRILGNDGLDTIWGGAGGDTIFGGNDADTIHGESGIDRIRAGAGDDWVSGGIDRDVILGEAGNDTINGDGGRDSLYGGDDDDTIDGGEDTDLIRGQAGNDMLLGGPSGNDRLVGGAGDDTLDVSAGSGSNRLLGDDSDGSPGSGNDTFIGSAQLDRMWGHDGNDIMHAGGFGDLLRGGAGNDELHGEAGTDVIDGGADDDILFGGPNAFDRLVGGAGIDHCDGGSGPGDFANATCETTANIP